MTRKYVHKIRLPALVHVLVLVCVCVSLCVCLFVCVHVHTCMCVCSMYTLSYARSFARSLRIWKREVRCLGWLVGVVYGRQHRTWPNMHTPNRTKMNALLQASASRIYVSNSFSMDIGYMVLCILRTHTTYATHCLHRKTKMFPSHRSDTHNIVAVLLLLRSVVLFFMSNGSYVYIS